jgi:hypothetical protein
MPQSFVLFPDLAQLALVPLLVGLGLCHWPIMSETLSPFMALCPLLTG